MKKLSEDDVKSVWLLAECWGDVQAHFTFRMKEKVEKELKNRGMIG